MAVTSDFAKIIGNLSDSEYITNLMVKARITDQQFVILAKFLGLDGEPISVNEIANLLSCDPTVVTSQFYEGLRGVKNNCFSTYTAYDAKALRQFRKSLAVLYSIRQQLYPDSFEFLYARPDVTETEIDPLRQRIIDILPTLPDNLCRTILSIIDVAQGS